MKTLIFDQLSQFYYEGEGILHFVIVNYYSGELSEWQILWI